MTGERRNDMSGYVGGHMVQAGSVQGDVVIDGAVQAQFEHARALREERLSAYDGFLRLAAPLYKQVQDVANLAVIVARHGGPQAIKYPSLGDRSAAARRSFEALRPLTEQVQMVGPDGAWEAARGVSANCLAVLLSSNTVLETSGQLPHRWGRDHQRLMQNLANRMSQFRDEIRRVRQAPLL
ncbi:hypothetical protein [Streptomyces smyrnaeus]|uniref:hypothetical protein n=1 Tax=Streptomyces smyrnaeus TaxID=1387713 RepID=UPI0036823C28